MEPERYIAVDNVCAWPNLTLMSNGILISTIFNQPTHGGWEGDVECWASQDDGRTWHLRGVPAPHEPGTNRMNVAAGCGHDGHLIVLASGWSRRSSVGDYSSPHDGEVLPVWVCCSEDGGETWERSETLVPPEGKNRPLIPFGDVVPISNNELGVCLYGWSSPDERNAYFYTSSDNGRNWEMRGIIREGDITETTPVALPDGRILVAARTVDDQHLDILESEDNGSTWNFCGQVTLGFQHPGHLLLLSDGRLLLSYGLRNKGLYGVGVRLSSDAGKTWEPPRVLVNFQTTTDGGYPSNVQVEDGTIVTAYYCKGIAEHQRYHMGVVRWSPDED